MSPFCLLSHFPLLLPAADVCCLLPAADVCCLLPLATVCCCCCCCTAVALPCGGAAAAAAAKPEISGLNVQQLLQQQIRRRMYIKRWCCLFAAVVDALGCTDSSLPGPPSLPLPHGDLTSWAAQGVLLLNAILTVRRDSPMAHKDAV